MNSTEYYLGPSVTILKFCGFWAEKRPRGFLQWFQKLHRYLLKLGVCLFWCCTVYTTTLQFEEAQNFFGGYMGWFCHSDMMILTQYLILFNISALQEFLGNKTPENFPQTLKLFAPYRRKAMKMLVLYGKKFFSEFIMRCLNKICCWKKYFLENNGES
jgi:transcription elongation factor GreA-like protein